MPPLFADVYKFLTDVNWAIYSDLYPQFLAYQAKGIKEIERMKNANLVSPEQFAGWQQIDTGNAKNDQNLVWAGNTALLKYEQQHTARLIYDVLPNTPMFAFISDDPWFKTQLKSPIPGDTGTFRSVVPNHADGTPPNLANFNDRWQWITTPNTGQLDKYKAWAATHNAINLADVTNQGVKIELGTLPSLSDMARILQWVPS